MASRGQPDGVYALSIGAVLVSTAGAAFFLADTLPTRGVMAQGAADKVAAWAGAPLPYRLHAPSWTLRLPRSLQEVSGVTVEASGTLAWAVNDEQAKLFQIDLRRGRVSEGRRFAKRGDYEGIALLGEALMVARSDGTLWRVGPERSTRLASPLSEAYDVEGLAVDAARKRLLVACKGKAGRGKAMKGKKAIYALSVPALRWAPEPAYLVELKALGQLLKRAKAGRFARSQAKRFAPSAIAVAPQSGQVYLLSSTARLLLVLDGETGAMRSAVALSRAMHPQPEGLSFDAAGALYLSNEGRGSEALLYRFDRQDELGSGEDEQDDERR